MADMVISFDKLRWRPGRSDIVDSTRELLIHLELKQIGNHATVLENYQTIYEQNPALAGVFLDMCDAVFLLTEGREALLLEPGSRDTLCNLEDRRKLDMQIKEFIDSINKILLEFDIRQSPVLPDARWWEQIPV